MNYVHSLGINLHLSGTGSSMAQPFLQERNLLLIYVFSCAVLAT